MVRYLLDRFRCFSPLFLGASVVCHFPPNPRPPVTQFHSPLPRGAECNLPLHTPRPFAPLCFSPLFLGARSEANARPLLAVRRICFSPLFLGARSEARRE